MAYRSIRLWQVCLTNKCIFQNYRSIVSALHINGGKPNTVSILTPSLTHIDTLIRNKPKLVNMLDARQMQFDIDSFIRVWDEMNSLRIQREDLENKRNQVNDLVKVIVKNKKSKVQESQLNFDQLKEEGKRLRKQLKQLTPKWWAIEEEAVTKALSLPNYIHTKTPSENRLVESYKTIPEEIGENNHIHCENIKITSSNGYFLKGPLALMELDWIQSFSQRFVEEGFNQMTGPDFVKSIIVDGCGIEFNNPKSTFGLDKSSDYGDLESGNGLHLVGGGSLASIVAFLTKNYIQEPFPLRLMSIGRQYQPTEGLPGLFGASQASAIQLLTALENDPDSLYDECQHICTVISDRLRELDVHFRVVDVSPRHLQRWEQFRSSVQLYSPSLEDYVQIASVSIVGDFISRRLAIYGPKTGSFPAFVTSTALCVPKLLASYLENQ